MGVERLGVDLLGVDLLGLALLREGLVAREDELLEGVEEREELDLEGVELREELDLEGVEAREELDLEGVELRVDPELLEDPVEDLEPLFERWAKASSCECRRLAKSVRASRRRRLCSMVGASRVVVGGDSCKGHAAGECRLPTIRTF